MRSNFLLLLICLFSYPVLCQAAPSSSVTPSTASIKNIPTPSSGPLPFPVCTGSIRQRREIRDLSQTEINALVNAYIAVTNNGGINSLVSLHTQTTIHFTPNFFPWHRIFLRKFEDLMQTQLGPDWAMPYWDWSIDSQHPDQSVIFSSNYFGQNDQSGGTYMITDSLMKNFQAQIPSPHPLTRAYNGAMGVFTASSVLEAQYIVQSMAFSTFSQNFENLPHAIVHTEIGGDMGVMMSPNDILFWMHHAFIDKVWWEWQSLGNNINKYDGSAYGPRYNGLNPSSIIPDFNVPVSSVLNSTQLCFTYVSPSQTTFNMSVDFGLTNITAPTTVPTSWLNQSSNSNITLAKTLLNQTQTITNNINQAANGSSIPVQRVTDKNSGSWSQNVLGVAFILIVSVLTLI